MEFWRTGSYNFDIDAFTHKFMLDVTDAQNSAGAFSDVSPTQASEDGKKSVRLALRFIRIVCKVQRR
jgi:hypothetical protein